MPPPDVERHATPVRVTGQSLNYDDLGGCGVAATA